MVLKGKEILSCCRTMNICHKRHWCTSLVHSHGNAFFLCIIADSFGFQKTSRGGQVRMNDVYSVLINQRLEIIEEVNIFSRCSWRFQGLGDGFVLLSHLPRHHVLQPSQSIRLQCFTQTNAIIQIKMPIVIG